MSDCYDDCEFSTENDLKLDKSFSALDLTETDNSGMSEEKTDLPVSPIVVRHKASPSRRKNHRGGKLSDEDLGVKQSFTVKVWRAREKEMHQKSLKNMKSPVFSSIEKHMHDLDRADGIMGHGQRNKAKAVEEHLKVIKQRNDEMAKRLQNIHEAPSEFSASNNTSLIKRDQERMDRMRYLDDIRRSAQEKLDDENGRFLKRLTSVQSTLPTAKEFNREYDAHLKLKHKMSKLQCPPELPTRKHSGAGRKRPQTANLILPTLNDAHGAYSPKRDSISSAARPRTAANRKKATRPGRKNSDGKKSLADRGQICHEHVDIQQIRGGQNPMLRQMLLVGFKSPTDADKVVFEVSDKDFVRYASVSRSDVKDAIDAYTSNMDTQDSKSILARAAASRLSLFGDSDADAMLMWKSLK